MTASSVDTAELPLYNPPRAVAVSPLRTPPVPSPEPARPNPLRLVPGEATTVNVRAELRAERQQLRRQQRRWALFGLSVMAGTLGATVAVLDVIH
jgi:hypothetical protein